LNPALALLRATLRDSLALWRGAPWLVLPAVATELLQHRAEVQLGMFASSDAFRMMAMAPARWWWGGWKLAAIGFAVIAGLWLWGRRDGGRVLWTPLALALVLNGLAMMPGQLIEGRFDPATAALAGFSVSLIALPLIPYLAGALIGDGAMTLRAAFTRGWWPALRMLLVIVAGFVPLQALHLANHRLAMGQPAPLLWSLLVWDALVVGAMAGWMATAFHHGYRGSAPFAKR
jgi:hypothetical protein